MEESIYFNGEVIEEPEFEWEFYDLPFEWPETCEVDEPDE